MDQPIPFILTGGDGISLKVDNQAKEALGKIKKPVVVVSVVGMYRTGKSFLLNRLMNRTDGFPLGSTVEAKTKGIWMWVGDFPGDSTKAMVLLDTELRIVETYVGFGHDSAIRAKLDELLAQ